MKNKKISLVLMTAVLFFSHPAYARRISEPITAEEILIQRFEEIIEAAECNDIGLVQTLFHKATSLKHLPFWRYTLKDLGKNNWKAQVYIAISNGYSQLLENYEKAIEFAEKAGDCYVEIGMNKEAAKQYGIGAAFSMTRLAQRDYQTAVGLNIKSGNCLYQEKLYDQAALQYLRAASILSTHLHNKQEALEYTIKSGECYLEANMYSEAAKEYIIASSIYSSVLKNYNAAAEHTAKAGYCYAMAEMYSKAIYQYQLAAYKTLDTVKREEYLALAHEYNIKINPALQAEDAIRKFELEANICLTRAQGYLRSGDTITAKEYFYKAADYFEKAKMFIDAQLCYEKIDEL